MGGWYEITIGRLLAKPRGFGGANRAQSQVIGAILIFGFIIAALGAAQLTLVPQANEEVEFNHNEQAQRDMHDLRQAIRQSAVTGVSQSASVDLGPSYPTRFLLLNPPSPAGTIRTVGGDDAEVKIRNALALEDEVEDFWDGSRTVSGPGKSIVYDPNYNLYDNAPKTVYENSILYNNFPSNDEYIVRTDQDIVDGRRIYLTAIGGEKSLSTTESETLDVKPVSPAAETIAVQKTGSGPVEVTIPTRLPEDVWVQQILAEEIDGGGSGGPTVDSCQNPFDDDGPNDEDGRYIVGCDYDGDNNEITLIFQRNNGDGKITYSLRMAKVGVGTSVDNPGAAYITDVQGDGADIAVNGRQEVVFQVRDEYNNPVTGVNVDVRMDDGDQGRLLYQNEEVGDDGDDSIPVGPNGKVELVYEAPSSIDTKEYSLNIDAKFADGSFDVDDDAEDDDGPKDATVSLEVINAAQLDRTEPLFNSPDGIVVRGSEFSKGPQNNEDACGNSKNCEVKVRFENTADSERTIEEMRYVFFSADSQGLANTDPTGALEIQDFENNGEILELKGDTVDIDDVEFDSGGDKIMTVHIYQDASLNNAASVGPGDYLVLSAIVNGERRTYFFAPADGTSTGPDTP